MDTRRRARCSGKIKHPSRGKAEAAMRSLERLNPDERYEVYVCPFQGKNAKRPHYHVGHFSAGNPKNKYRKTDARK